MIEDLLNEIKKLDYQKRVELLNNKDIVRKLYLIEKENDILNLNRVLELFNVYDLLKVFTKEIGNQITKMYPYSEFIFLKILKNKNQDEFYKVLKENDDLKEFLLFKGEYLYKNLNFPYEIVINLINYIENNNIDYKKTCIYLIMTSSLKEDNLQKQILNEKINDIYKIKMFNIFDPNLITNYLNENIVNLSLKDTYNILKYSEVKLNKNLYENKEFFKMFILGSSIYNSRLIIEKLKNNIDTTYFENILNDMEDDILSMYLVDNKIINYTSSEKISSLFLEKQFNNNKKDKKEITKKIIIMIVIDKLFQDNLRNVCLNVAEIINFNLNNNILSKEKLLFYKEIINLYNQSSDYILDFYNKYKDMVLVSDYYDDIYKCKEKSYELLKESCLKIEDLKNNKNNSLSNLNNIDIYELDGQDFRMLVTCRRSIPEGYSKVARNCYSLIGNENMNVFNENNIIYGYLNFDIRNIMHVYEYDSYSENQSMNTTNFINRIRTPNEILSSNHMNEIQILNNYIDKDKYERIYPSYIVCFDKLDKRSLEASHVLNIPIIIINRSKYKNNTTGNMLENYGEEYTVNSLNEMTYQDKTL